MTNLEIKKRRIFYIIQIGSDDDLPSRLFDFASIFMILANLFIAIAETFDGCEKYLPALNALELVTVLFFTVEYALRVWTAEYLLGAAYSQSGPENTGRTDGKTGADSKTDNTRGRTKTDGTRGRTKTGGTRGTANSASHISKSQMRAKLKYIISFSGIIDLLSFLPYYLPVFFPAGIVAFRMFRVVRIFRLFRINAYYDELNVIMDVIKSKKDQLLSSIFIILVLMTGSSLCMYSLEHEAQPEVFRNAFSGFWWAAATLLTVGYGDIYPITAAGRVLGIIITFLGVGMVAIPTGILSAGFVEQYTKMKDFERGGVENGLDSIRFEIDADHPLNGLPVSTLTLPDGLFLSGIQRRRGVLSPKPDIILEQGDKLILCAETTPGDEGPILKKITLKAGHPWCGLAICDLDISRQTQVLVVLRGKEHLSPAADNVSGKAEHLPAGNDASCKTEHLLPAGDLVLRAGDRVLLYTKRTLSGAAEMQVL